MQSLKERYSGSKFITGLRAYAALGVFLLHCEGGGLRQFSPFTNSIVDFGKYGVIVFFVLSAFTISMSIDNKPGFNFRTYLLQRFLRIAPMYYVALLVGFLLGANAYYLNYFHVDNDLKSLLLHVSFLNLFFVKYQNNIIGVEWTVPIEFFFYLIIPLLFFQMLKRPNIIPILLMLAAIVSVSSYKFYTHSNYADLQYNWSLFKYPFSFVFGVVVYLAYRKKIFFIDNPKYANWTMLLLILVFFDYIFMGYLYKDLFSTIWIGLLIIACQRRAFITRAIFENVVVQYLGKISYSIYLVHMLVLTWLGSRYTGYLNPCLALAITIGISSLTYYLIEKPFIKLGKQLEPSTPLPAVNTF
ncbi:MAG: acyltransferase 3 [Mucilaginibacter sp.]|nr:acyltransferase 3 [Mucilaginibacter sp.]